MLWFWSRNRAEIEAKKCIFGPDFLGAFIDDIRISESMLELLIAGQ